MFCGNKHLYIDTKHGLKQSEKPTKHTQRRMLRLEIIVDSTEEESSAVILSRGNAERTFRISQKMTVLSIIYSTS